MKGNCLFTDTILISPLQDNSNRINDTTICDDEALIINVTKDIVEWDDGTRNNNRIINLPGTYWIDYVYNGCVVRDSFVLQHTLCHDCRIDVPNIFSPNGDGINDQLVITANCDLEYFDWKIFDRWGNTVFQSNSPNNSWDGNTLGNICLPGVYSYYIKAIGNNNIPIIIVGDITLIR